MKCKQILMALIALCIFATGCGIKNSVVQRPMDHPVIQVAEINPRISNEKLKQIIIAACSKYGWGVDKTTDSSVTATLRHGKETVTIDIPYSPSKVEFVYKSSQNMRYEGNKIHRSYNRWLKNLEVEIRNGIVASH